MQRSPAVRTAVLILPLVLTACASRDTADPHAFTFSDPSPHAPMASGEVDAPVRYADQNRDGRVTRREAAVDPALQRSFDRYDANDDDVLDRGEFARLEAESRAGDARTPSVREGFVMTAPEPAAARRRHSLNRTGIDEVRPEDE